MQNEWLSFKLFYINIHLFIWCWLDVVKFADKEQLINKTDKQYRYLIRKHEITLFSQIIF